MAGLEVDWESRPGNGGAYWVAGTEVDWGSRPGNSGAHWVAGLEVDWGSRQAAEINYEDGGPAGVPGWFTT